MLSLLLLALPSLGNSVDPDVTVLTDDNFDSFIKDHPLTLVEFYAPWCGHCKKLTPEYASAATTLLKEDPPIQLGKVDATEFPDLAGRFGVQGYPTLKVFRGDPTAPADYNGPRQAAGIVKYMRGQSGPSATPLTRGAALDKFLAFEEDVSVVGYFTAEDSPAAKAFLAAANTLREDFRFGIVTGEDTEAVKTHRPASWKGEEAEVVFKGDATDVEALKRFVGFSSVPLAGEYSADTAARYSAVRKPRLTVYTSVDRQLDPSGYKYYTNRLRKVAKESQFASTMLFALSDKASGPGAQEFSELGFEADATYGMGVFDVDGSKYKFEGDAKFSVDAVQQFATKFLAGEVEKHIKSEPVPTEQEGDVVTLVGKNFDEIVFDNDKDVLVEFYAPWCGHCKSLAPKYEKLATKLKGVEGITIAKLDATANDYSKRGGVSVSGFPTLYLYKAGDKDHPVTYQGAREVKDFITFLKAEATHGGDIGNKKKAATGKEEL